MEDKDIETVRVVNVETEYDEDEVQILGVEREADDYINDDCVTVVEVNGQRVLYVNQEEEEGTEGMQIDADTEQYAQNGNTSVDGADFADFDA